MSGRLLGANWLTALCLAVVLLVPASAVAERVLVLSGNDERGHAWLFGWSGRDGVDCWLAVPRHVVEQSDGRLRPFLFQDKSGRSGESGQPVAVGEMPNALEAAAGESDLAFAPVVAGRANGECLSRLGRTHHTYDAALRRAPVLVVHSLLPNSFGIFRVSVSRASTRSAGGILRLRALQSEDTQGYLKLGISGSVAEITDDADTVPFAMILRVDTERRVFEALRFDRIRSAFDHLNPMAIGTQRVQQGTADVVPYQIVAVEAMTLGPETGPQSLRGMDSCWMIAPVDGAEAAVITIQLMNADDWMSAVVLVQDQECGNAPIPFIVDQRLPDQKVWIRARTCQSTSNPDTTDCAIELAAPRVLRISIPGPGPIGLSTLIIR